MDTLPDFVIPEEYEKELIMIPASEKKNEFFRLICAKGLKEKGFDSNKEYIDRFELEFKRITEKEYTNYFLIVWDYVQWCNKQGIMVGPGRGSAGSSLHPRRVLLPVGGLLSKGLTRSATRRGGSRTGI